MTRRALVRGLVALATRPRTLTAALVTLFFGCSATYSIVEGKGPVEGAWWALVTASTVGYGDQYPATTIGRAVGAVLILGMWLLSILAVAQVTARIIPDPHVFTDDEQKRVLATLDRVAGTLDAVAGELARERGGST